jgi:tetratricopeptide (TPR) repeat protein
MKKEINQEVLKKIVSDAVSDVLEFRDWHRKPLGSPAQYYYERLYKWLRDYCGLDGYAMFPREATTKEDCLQIWLDILNDFWSSDLSPENDLDWDAVRDSGLSRLRLRCGIQAVAENSLDLAAALFRQAAEDTEIREARQFLGYALLELGKYREAQGAFERQLELDVWDIPPRLGIALATLYTGSDEGARRLAEDIADNSVAVALKEEVEWYRREEGTLEYAISPRREYWKARLYSGLLVAVI